MADPNTYAARHEAILRGHLGVPAHIDEDGDIVFAWHGVPMYLTNNAVDYPHVVSLHVSVKADPANPARTTAKLAEINEAVFAVKAVLIDDHVALYSDMPLGVAGAVPSLELEVATIVRMADALGEATEFLARP